MEPPTHTPDPDDLRELCGLVAALRAWSHTPGDEHDAGRDHPLFPPKQYRDGAARTGPLWMAVERVLARHGFARGQL